MIPMEVQGGWAAAPLPDHGHGLVAGLQIVAVFRRTAAGHHLEHRVDIRTGDEFEDLATSFNTMSADLRKNIDDLQRTTAEKERYSKELEIAKEIQVAVRAGGVGVLIARLCGKGLRARYYKTWGCGLNLTPRMEYSAMGFAQPIKQVFETIYQPAVKLEREFLEQSKYFIRHQRFHSTIEPLFEKYAYQPVVKAMLAAAERLRVIQAGSLHLYLAYIFVTLVLLLLWAG